MNTIDYTYIGKPRDVIISELFANDLKSISKLPTELFYLELNKFVNPQEIAIKNLSENNHRRCRVDIRRDLGLPNKPDSQYDFNGSGNGSFDPGRLLSRLL